MLGRGKLMMGGEKLILGRRKLIMGGENLMLGRGKLMMGGEKHVKYSKAHGGRKEAHVR